MEASWKIPETSDAAPFDRGSVLTRIQEMLNHRVAVAEIQRALEDAWKGAISECLALNRKLDSSDLPESPEKRILIQAEAKRRRMEALQQNAFLMFQMITENKYEKQIEKGGEFLEMAGDCPEEVLAARAEEFLIEENTINHDLLEKFAETRKTLENLKAEAGKIRLMPCEAKELGKHLNHDLRLLEAFLKSTGELLGAEIGPC